MWLNQIISKSSVKTSCLWLLPLDNKTSEHSISLCSRQEKKKKKERPKRAPQTRRISTYRSESKPVTDLQWGGKVFSPILLPTKSPGCCQFWQRERYMGFISSWTNESNLWVLQNNSYSQPKAPDTHTHTHTKRATGRCMRALLNWWGLIERMVSHIR